MERFMRYVAAGYVLVATLGLMSVAVALLVSAMAGVVRAISGPGFVDAALEGVGLAIIGFAVMETAKFLAEEELLRKRELRAAIESRRSLTKFITIIVIAASLEALVMIFKTSRTGIELAVFPAVLFGSAMIALVSLGAYQWLSSRIYVPPEDKEPDVEER